MEWIFILLVIYQAKHFLADYPLQGSYMLGKFKPGWDFIPHLAAHCAVHGIFTYGIAYAFRYHDPLSLALIDFSIHFAMDRIKASPRYLGRFKALSGAEYVGLLGVLNGISLNAVPEIKKKFRDNTLFWWSLGLDQMVHHLTHYYLIWKIING
jgi:hypothetical protein